MLKLLKYRWLFFVLIILGLFGAIVTLGAMEKRIEAAGLESPTGPVWTATNVEFENLRLQNELLKYALGQSDAAAVNLSFDLLWSRVTQMGTGAAAEQVSTYDIDLLVFDQLMQKLREIEPHVVSLPNETTETEQSLSLFVELAQFNNSLRKTSLRILEGSATAIDGWRSDLVQVLNLNRFLGIGVGIALLLLFGIYGLDSFQSKRQSAESKRLLEDARAAAIAKSQFISVMNHELRTPLTSIKGALALINANMTGTVPDKLKRMLGIADRNAEKLCILINDLLDVDKLTSGSVEYDFIRFDLSTLLFTDIETTASYAEQYGVQIIASDIEPNVAVQADRNRMSQVVTNLLSNACKFSDTGSKVRVGLSTSRNAAIIAIQDSGRGIPKSEHARVFERFYQVDGTNSREKPGTGLGLSIVESIVEAHGGTVSFESEVGQGTTFFVSLPLAAA